MPLITFNNLKSEKKQKVTDALLIEFSNNSLADAQVARIVKQAAISRGSFYKYFQDLTDAYRYLYDLVIREIHGSLGINDHNLLTVDDYYEMVSNFLNHPKSNKYFLFIKRHFTENEGISNVSSHFSANLDPVSEPVWRWGAANLCHGTIRQYFLRPDLKDELLEYLQISLKKIEA